MFSRNPHRSVLSSRMTTIASNDESVAQTYECSECKKELPTERGLSSHKGQMHFDSQPVPLYLKNGYEYWEHRYQGESDTVAVHQLLAIADGESPYDVFSPDTDVHHSDIEHKRANLPDNLEVLDHAEHGLHHSPPIPDEDLLEDLRRLADELGHSPTKKDIREHGKYHYNTYLAHFGGLSEAYSEARLSTEVDISHLHEKEQDTTVDISHLE